MAQIVSIDTGTKRNNNEIGDIVAVHEDDVDLGGGGYSTFKIIQVKGITLSELSIAINLKIPKQQPVYRMPVADTWSPTPPEEKTVWKDTNGKWQFLEKQPKYALTIKDMTAQDITDLDSGVKTRTEKLIILDKVQEKISLDSVNLIEATDLNV